MNKDKLIGLGLIGIPFAVVGGFIGGIIVNKINDKYSNRTIDMWKDTSEFFKNQLINEYEKNNKLNIELRSKDEA